MTEKYNIPYSICNGRYLNNNETILLTGTLTNTTTFLEIRNISSNSTSSSTSSNNNNNNNNNNSYLTSDSIITSSTIPGINTSTDIYGSSHLGKSFVAITTNINGNSSFSIYEIPLNDYNSNYNANNAHSNNNNKFIEVYSNNKYENTIFTNITSHTSSNQLTTCTEFGDVIIHDLNGREIENFNADYCGLQTIKYSNSGLLITVGLSYGGQLLLWDTRTSLKSPSLSRCLRPPSLSSSSTSLTYPTTILTSHRNDYDMLCGTSTGSVIQWDTRYEGLIFSPHQVHDTNASVTSLAHHPNDYSTVISGASDGTISLVEYDLFTINSTNSRQKDHSYQQQSNQSKMKILSDIYEIPHKEIRKNEKYLVSGVTSLDTSDGINKKILVTGELGEVAFLDI